MDEKTMGSRARKSQTMGLVYFALAAPFVFAAMAATAAPPILRSNPEIEKAVYDAQVLENLHVYCNPEDFRPKALEAYFVPMREGGEAAKDVIAAVGRQLDHGLRYGAESRLDMFEVLSSSVDSALRVGKVRVHERWYLPTYRTDGTRLQEKRAFFNHEIDYTLRKIRGKWLLQASTTPYAQ